MSEQQTKRGMTDSTVARIAGNLMSGYVEVDETRRQEAVVRAVAQARAIVAEVERTSPSVGKEQ